MADRPKVKFRDKLIFGRAHGKEEEVSQTELDAGRVMASAQEMQELEDNGRLQQSQEHFPWLKNEAGQWIRDPELETKATLLPARAQLVCRYFLRSTGCRKGDKCRMLHRYNPTPAPPPPPAALFQRLSKAPQLPNPHHLTRFLEAADVSDIDDDEWLGTEMDHREHSSCSDELEDNAMGEVTGAMHGFLLPPLRLDGTTAINFEKSKSDGCGKTLSAAMGYFSASEARGVATQARLPQVLESPEFGAGFTERPLPENYKSEKDVSVIPVDQLDKYTMDDFFTKPSKREGASQDLDGLGSEFRQVHHVKRHSKLFYGERKNVEDELDDRPTPKKKRVKRSKRSGAQVRAKEALEAKSEGSG